MVLPGLVGSGALWLRGLRRGGGRLPLGEWLALAGEPGVGKLAVVRAVHQRRNPGGRFTVLDATDAGDAAAGCGPRRELMDGEGALVIRHLDPLDGRAAARWPARLRGQAAGRQRAVGRGDLRARHAERAGAELGCCGSSRARSSCRRCATTSRTCTAGAVLRRPARPDGAADLLAGGAADADAVELAGQHRAALPGAQRVVQHRRSRRDPAGRPAAGVPHGQPPAAQPAGVDGTRRDRAQACSTATATRSRRPSRSACPAPRSTARSTSTASSRRPLSGKSGSAWRAVGHAISGRHRLFPITPPPRR